MSDKPSMNPWEKRVFILASMILVYFIVVKITDSLSNNDKSNFVKTEIDSVKFIPPVQAVHNNYPTKIIYQTVIDTTRRSEAEKQDIITGVKIDGNKVEIQKIDSAGHVTQETHLIEEGSRVIIDNKGFEEKKRTKAGKFIRKVSKVALKGLQVVGAVALVYVVVK